MHLAASAREAREPAISHPLGWLPRERVTPLVCGRRQWQRLMKLIAYVVPRDNVQITIIVFPGLSHGNFDNPVINPTQLEPAFKGLIVVTGEFMKLLTKR